MHGPSSLDDNLHKEKLCPSCYQKAAVTAFAYIIGELLVDGFCMKENKFHVLAKWNAMNNLNNIIHDLIFQERSLPQTNGSSISLTQDNNTHVVMLACRDLR
jgi:hypothetical protein